MQMYDSKANGLLRLLGIEGCVRYFWRPHRSGIPSVWEGEPESATAVWLFIFLSRLTTPGWKGEAIRIEAGVWTFILRWTSGQHLMTGTTIWCSTGMRVFCC